MTALPIRHSATPRRPQFATCSSASPTTRTCAASSCPSATDCWQLSSSDSAEKHAVTAGRFAPSPSGDLHVGNLRTAVLAWLHARRSDRAFLVRVEDLDRVRPGAEERQLADLAAIGLDWDGPVV